MNVPPLDRLIQPPATYGSPDVIRVVVADDHPLFLAGLRGMIEDDPRSELVGEATDGLTVLTIVQDSDPDVVVMDLSMPGLSGIDATQRILIDHPHVRVLVLTMADDDASLYAAMKAGARGYALKGSRPAEILAAIHAVADGMAIFSPAIAGRVTGMFATVGNTIARAFPNLTAREQDVLNELGKGHTNSQIARTLHLTEKTVRNNVSAVLTKLQVTDRFQAAERVRAAGLLDT